MREIEPNSHTLKHHEQDFLYVLNERVMRSDRGPGLAEGCAATQALVTLSLVAVNAGFLDFGMLAFYGRSWLFSACAMRRNQPQYLWVYGAGHSALWISPANGSSR